MNGLRELKDAIEHDAQLKHLFVKIDDKLAYVFGDYAYLCAIAAWQGELYKILRKRDGITDAVWGLGGAINVIKSLLPDDNIAYLKIDTRYETHPGKTVYETHFPYLSSEIPWALRNSGFIVPAVRALRTGNVQDKIALAELYHWEQRAMMRAFLLD